MRTNLLSPKAHGVLDYALATSLLVARSGTLVLEEYFAGYAADRSHNLHSATKSVTSLGPQDPTTFGGWGCSQRLLR